MRNVRWRDLSCVAGCLSLWSCHGELVVGENRCYGEGIVCASEAPTLSADRRGDLPGSSFDVAAARMIEPAWVYDLPVSAVYENTEIAPAYNGGVWAKQTVDRTTALHRINASGHIVDSQLLASDGALMVDSDSLDALVLAGRSYQRVNGRGEIAQYPFVGIQAVRSYMWLAAPGRDGGLRLALFQEPRGSYVAEYDTLAGLVWKQSDLKLADRVFAKDALEASYGTPAFQLVPLNDGALAVLLPKRGTSRPALGAVGTADFERVQGVTLLEPDGNVRWHLVVGGSSQPPTLAAPGPNGGLVLVGPGFASDPSILLIDRDGAVAAQWMARRVGYYSGVVKALCTDPAGDIYTLGLSGGRGAAIATVCRIDASDTGATPECVGVEDLSLTTVEDGVPLANDGEIQMLYSIPNLVAPEAGGVVFTVQEFDLTATMITRSRLVRVNF